MTRENPDYRIQNVVFVFEIGARITGVVIVGMIFLFFMAVL